MNESDAVPNTVEGNIKAKKTEIRRRVIGRAGVRDMITNANAEYGQANIDVEQCVLRNFAIISGEVIHDNNVRDVGMTGSCLNIGGDVFVMPRHYWIRFKQYEKLYTGHGNTFRLRLSFTHASSTPVFMESISVYEPIGDHLVDVVFLKIRHISFGRDIRKFFIKQSDDPNCHGAYLYGPRTREQKDTDPIS